MNRYEAVLFDFDGVLVDSEPIHFDCWQEILGPFGIDLDWDTYCEHCIGVTDRAMLAFLCTLSKTGVSIESLGAEYPRKKAMFRERMLKVDLAEDLRALIAELKPHYKLGVVTSSNILEVGPFLEASGVMASVDVVVHGGEVKHHKPHPEPYLLAVERLGVKSALAVEDSRAGIAAARAAGLDVVEIRDQRDVSNLVKAAVQSPPAV